MLNIDIAMQQQQQGTYYFLHVLNAGEFTQVTHEFSFMYNM
jgi:hypothetical protein